MPGPGGPPSGPPTTGPASSPSSGSPSAPGGNPPPPSSGAQQESHNPEYSSRPTGPPGQSRLNFCIIITFMVSIMNLIPLSFLITRDTKLQ